VKDDTDNCSDLMRQPIVDILCGIENRLEADPLNSSSPSDEEPILPGNGFEALGVFENSCFVAQSMGEDLQEAFIQMKRVEQLEFTGAVSPFEYNTYLVIA